MHRFKNIACFVFIGFAITFIPSFVSAQQNNISDTLNIDDSTGLVGANAKLTLISAQFSFTEGPASDRFGNVFFTDQPNNKIWKYDIAGKLSVFLDSAGRSNGMYFDMAGNLISCADDHNELWSIAPSKKITVLLKDLNGTHFNGPNDCWINRNGSIYFTDPYYQREYWTRTKPEMSGQFVYRFDHGKIPVVVEDKLEKPNGIIGTQDGKLLYIADIKAWKTYRYDIAKDGSLINKKLFTDQGSDGITLDERGNLYLTGKGVTIFDIKGKKIGHIDVPGDWTANITFGGKDRKTLFITASKAIYTLQMNVKGQ